MQKRDAQGAETRQRSASRLRIAESLAGVGQQPASRLIGARDPPLRARQISQETVRGYVGSAELLHGDSGVRVHGAARAPRSTEGRPDFQEAGRGLGDRAPPHGRDGPLNKDRQSPLGASDGDVVEPQLLLSLFHSAPTEIFERLDLAGEAAEMEENGVVPVAFAAVNAAYMDKVGFAVLARKASTERDLLVPVRTTRNGQAVVPKKR